MTVLPLEFPGVREPNRRRHRGVAAPEGAN